MLQAIEAMTDQDGNLHIPGVVNLPRSRRVIITILDEAPAAELVNPALLSEAALAHDWDQPEEDLAWSGLNQLLLPPEKL